MIRLFAYASCQCGMLVRLSRLDPNSETAKGLARLNSHAFAGECPSCKVLSQLTLTNPSPIITSKG